VGVQHSLRIRLQRNDVYRCTDPLSFNSRNGLNH
jgi:hypothetical protein